MATNFRIKIGKKIGRLIFIRLLGILEYRHFDLKGFICDDSGYIIFKFDELWSSKSGV